MIKGFFILLICLKTILASDFPWMYYLAYGKNVTLMPLFQNNTETILIQSCKWITPTMIPIMKDSLTYDTGRYFLDESKCELTIFNNQKDTNGIYHCIINNEFISKAMLNVYGAPKNTLTEEYLPNIIAGLSTAGAIIAAFAISCSVYKFKYKKPAMKNKIDSLVELPEVTKNNFFNNESFQTDDAQINSEKADIRF